LVAVYYLLFISILADRTYILH